MSTGITTQTGNVERIRLALSGNHLLVKINGNNVGYIQTITAQDDYAPEPLSGLGDIHVREWVPTMARYTIAIDRMVLRQASLMDVAGGMSDVPNGPSGASGGTSTVNGKGIWEDGYQAMQGFVFDIEAIAGFYPNPLAAVTDTNTVAQTGGTSAKHWYQCSFASGTLRIAKHTIVIEDATFYSCFVSGSNTVHIP
jgi:hypothetical protein